MQLYLSDQLADPFHTDYMVDEIDIYAHSFTYQINHSI
jgi:hypothetical protein